LSSDTGLRSAGHLDVAEKFAGAVEQLTMMDWRDSAIPDGEAAMPRHVATKTLRKCS
jgi:hypothetical protein